MICNEYGDLPYVADKDPKPQCDITVNPVVAFQSRQCTFPKDIDEDQWQLDLQSQCCAEETVWSHSLQSGLMMLMGFAMLAYVVMIKPFVCQ